MSDLLSDGVAASISVTLEAMSSSSISVGWTLHNAMGPVNVIRSDTRQPGNAQKKPTSNPWTDDKLSCGPIYTYTLSLVSDQTVKKSASSCTLNCATKASTYVIVIGHDIFPTQPLPLMLGDDILEVDSAAVLSHTVGEGQAGTFAFLVPRTTEILHYIHEKGSITQGNWQLAHKLELPDNYSIQDTALSLVQSTSGNLAALGRATPLQGGGKDSLAAYEFTAEAGWQGPFVPSSNEGPIDGVTGAQALIETTRGALELLVPRGGLIYHYMHDIGTISKGPWKLVSTLKPYKDDQQIQATNVSFVENTLGSLKAVARITLPPGEGDDLLIGYEYDQQTDSWSAPVALILDDGIPNPILPFIASVGNPINHITGSQALIESDYGSFELLVPRGDLVYHYTHNSESVTEGPWRLLDTLEPPRTLSDPSHPISVAPAISTLRNLEVVARQRPLQGNDFFNGYEINPALFIPTSITVLESDQGPIIASDS